MRVRPIGAVVIIVLAIVGAVLLRRGQQETLAENEAIAAIPLIDGIRSGTVVSYGSDLHPYVGRVGQVTSVERRTASMVVRIRFDRGMARRRGDAIRVVDTGAERVIMFVGAPSYEKSGRISDTLYLAHFGVERPQTTEDLFASLYRLRRGAPDSSARR